MKSRIITLILLNLSVLFTSSETKGQATIHTTITGSVLDARSGEALVGAGVLIQGTTNGTVTDINGAFKLLTGQKLPFTLVLSFVGYQKKEVVVRESQITLSMEASSSQLADVVITSRRRQESPQDVPIPLTVIRGHTAEDAGAFNVNRLKELIPTVQLYSSNPRNTTLNIRGLGSTFSLTNDGLDPGVGFYVDGVYYARPAATTLDFIDVEQIEVLRGPQGTLFGKNTTAGAFTISTRAPGFEPGGSFEVSYGNYGYIQAKASVTGPLGKKLAARASFSGTHRDGLLYNTRTQQHVNDLNNLGFRGQLLYQPAENTKITLAGDASIQRPNGYAQVIAGVVTTQRAAYRQFDAILADLNFTLPGTNPFDRIIDHDTPWRSDNALGGLSLQAETKLGRGVLTSITAWRYWNWNPSNDRDFTGLPVLALSQAPSRHDQWSQEIRFAGAFSNRISGVAGVFVLGQRLASDPYHTEESGAAQWRFAQNTTSLLWQTPGLLDGYGIRTTSRLHSWSGAVFGQVDWALTPKIHLLSGLRFNYDQKDVDYNRQTYGGLATNDPALLAIKNAMYSNQAFTLDVHGKDISGQLSLAYKPTSRINAFATYANSYKPVGVNLGGLPTANGQVLIELAKVKPEYVTHYELGVKTRPASGATWNLTAYNTDIQDYQTQVQSPELGVNRGYLANADRVRVKGIEMDGSYRINSQLSLTGSAAYTDGKYVSFPNAPVPLEEVGGEQAFKNISGGSLPGISKWAGTLGGEFSRNGNLAGLKGRFVFALDSYYRSSFSSSPSPSRYLTIDGYVLANGRIGFRASNGVSILLWSRNLLNTNYFEQLLPASGSAGHYAAVLGDPRTFGVTLRYGY